MILVKKSLNDKAIRPDQLMNQYLKLYEKDLVLLKSYMNSVNCPACDSSNYKQWVLKMGFNFVECNSCSTVYVNPRPNEESLKQFYTSAESQLFWVKIFKNTEKTRIEKIFKPRIKIIEEILKEKKIKCNRMVEVGAGYGWFSNLAKDNKIAKEIIAIEPSPISASVCRRSGIKVI